jgi:hypothetical protein
MSQGAGHKGKMRAIFAIVGVCALVFGLLAASAPHASARAGARGAALGVGAFCHDRDADVASAETAAPDKSRAKKQISCPCCLAAHAGSAVLPERFALLMRLERTATPAVYRSSTRSPPRFKLRQTVNGARAPPGFAPLA